MDFFTFFFGIFLTLPSTQTKKIIDWAMNMHFNPIPIL